MKKLFVVIAALCVGSFGCGDDGDNGTGGSGGAGATGGAAGTGGTAGGGGTGGAGAQQVSLAFAAVVGDEPFVCGDTYDNLGSDDTSLLLSDFRFYVSGVELKNTDGDWVAVTLDDTDFQTGDVALLDFEDGCSDSGNDPTNSNVTGTVPEGTYDGVRFGMGVPFDLNHNNPATAPSPLNLTTLQWDWQGGYKFVRIDSGTFSMTDWRMHLGSTGCDGDPISGGTTNCTSPNVVNVDNLDAFDPDTGTIVADFAALVAGAPLDTNQPMTPPGCMSGPGDADCAPFFDNLGLAFGGEPAPSSQSFFAVQ